MFSGGAINRTPTAVRFYSILAFIKMYNINIKQMIINTLSALGFSLNIFLSIQFATLLMTFLIIDFMTF